MTVNCVKAKTMIESLIDNCYHLVIQGGIIWHVDVTVL